MDAGLSVSRQKVNPSAMGIAGVPVPDPFSLYNASVSVSYALDLFGKNRRALEGLKAQVDRREFELEAVRQTLAANVVLASIRQAELEERISVAQDIVSARDKQLAIARSATRPGAYRRENWRAKGCSWSKRGPCRPHWKINRRKFAGNWRPISDVNRPKLHRTSWTWTVCNCRKSCQ